MLFRNWLCISLHVIKDKAKAKARTKIFTQGFEAMPGFESLINNNTCHFM